MLTVRHHLALFLIALLSATASAGVIVKRAAPDIQYKTFDPANPPAQRPHLEHGEGAVTVSIFDCQALGDYELVSRKRGDDGTWTAVVAVHRVTFSVKLRVVVWLPLDATDKLKAHEEGHRKLAELIYRQRADGAARAAAKVMDGRRLSGEGPDPEKAMVNAIEVTIQQVSRDYLSHTAGMSDEVNKIYDDITTHGTNDVPEEQAIREAFERYEKDHPTTRPATAPAARK